jgi:drug/metabolite transporter (DMT)-like permease
MGRFTATDWTGVGVGWRAWSAFAALGLIWGLPYFFIKLAVLEVSPSVIACSRVLLGTMILLPIAWQRGALQPLRRHKAAVCGFALAEFAIPFCAISWGERWISSSITGILIAMVPLCVVLMQRFFGLHERLGLWRILGLGLGFVGVAALLGLGNIDGPAQWAGVGCMLLATLGYAIGPLIIQRHLAGLDPFGPLAASLLVATLLLAVPALMTLPPRIPSAQTLVALAVLGVICTALAMLLMFYLVGHAGASRAAVITYINPAVAALLGVGVLHEPLGVGTVAAFVCILLGSWLATRGARTRPGVAAQAQA